jgi:hypothetical protein
MGRPNDWLGTREPRASVTADWVSMMAGGRHRG